MQDKNTLKNKIPLLSFLFKKKESKSINIDIKSPNEIDKRVVIPNEDKLFIKPDVK